MEKSETFWRKILALYCYLFEKIHNQKVAKWGVYFSGSNKYFEEPRDQEEINKAIEQVKQTRKEMTDCKKKNEWPKRYTPLCRWCDLYINGECNGEDDWLFGEG